MATADLIFDVKITDSLNLMIDIAGLVSLIEEWDGISNIKESESYQIAMKAMKRHIENMSVVRKQVEK